MTHPRPPRSVFTGITEGVYWFLVMDVMLVLASSPTVLAWAMLPAESSSALLLVLTGLPLVPALAAASYAWQRRSEDRELVPASRFLHGYRVNVVDSLKVGAPAVLVLAVLALNVSYGGSVGTAGLNSLFLVMGAVIMLLLARAITIVSNYSFRLIDVVRLSVFTLLTKPLATLALVSLGVLTLGLVLVVGELALLLTASLLTFAVWQSERPITRLVTEQFVSHEEGPAPDGDA